MNRLAALLAAIIASVVMFGCASGGEEASTDAANPPAPAEGESGMKAMGENEVAAPSEGGIESSASAADSMGGK